MSFDKNPQALIELWNSLSEPVKAFVFSLFLGLLMALRSADQGFVKKAIEVATAGVMGFGIGYICHLAGFPSWVIWSANTAIAVLGVDRARQIIDTAVNKWLPGKEPKTDG